MARRTPSVRGCPETDRTPATASKAAIWLQLPPEERKSRTNGRNSVITRCIGRGPSGPSNAAANRAASLSADFFVIIQIGCHDLPPAATPRNYLQQILAIKALRFVAIRYKMFHSHLCTTSDAYRITNKPPSEARPVSIRIRWITRIAHTFSLCFLHQSTKGHGHPVSPRGPRYGCSWSHHLPLQWKARICLTSTRRIEKISLKKWTLVNVEYVILSR